MSGYQIALVHRPLGTFYHNSVFLCVTCVAPNPIRGGMRVVHFKVITGKAPSARRCDHLDPDSWPRSAQALRITPSFS